MTASVTELPSVIKTLRSYKGSKQKLTQN